MPQDLSRIRINRDNFFVISSTKQRYKFFLIAALVVLILLGIAGILHFRSEIEVEVTTVSVFYPYQAHTLLNATGYVVPQRKAAVASKATGRLEWLGVSEGSQVEKDQIIARLENKDVQANKEQAEANIKVVQANLTQAYAELEEAETAFKRATELVSKNYVSRASLDSAETRYQKAKAAINSRQAEIAMAQANYRGAQVAFEQTLIRAPFDGVVLTKNANIGDVITPFSSALESKGAVVTMADMNTLEVEADVSESNIAKIKIGQPCEIQLDAFPDLRFQGIVNRTVPTLDRSKATLLVKVKFIERNPHVLPEMSAKVAFLSKAMLPEERKPIIVVSPDALLTRDGNKFVFMIDDGKAVETKVETGRKMGDRVEVRGVKAGDKAVLRPSKKLQDGSAVKSKAKE